MEHVIIDALGLHPYQVHHKFFSIDNLIFELRL